ncbi:MAG TPA: DNA repair protein RecO [Patescibacteria group bacterium]|nr:DNA repair protein RecO [Patescibacteria group bacterium]
MNQVVTQGIVLSRTDFSEADRILTILTPDHGRIRAIAKGVRKIKSKLAGGIELFSISQITYIQGKSDIYTLVSTRLDKHFGQITGNLERTMFGYEVLKLINKSVEDNAGEEYFGLLSQALAALDEQKLPQPAIELWLSAQLLKLAGHSPNLSTDIADKKLRQEQVYGFDIDKMAFAMQEAGSFTANHIKLLRLAFGLESPLGLGQVKDISKVLPASTQLVKLMRTQFLRA